jgi:hypothetical protein
LNSLIRTKIPWESNYRCEISMNCAFSSPPKQNETFIPITMQKDTFHLLVDFKLIPEMFIQKEGTRKQIMKIPPQHFHVCFTEQNLLSGFSYFIYLFKSAYFHIFNCFSMAKLERIESKYIKKQIFCSSQKANSKTTFVKDSNVFHSSQKHARNIIPTI